MSHYVKGAYFTLKSMGFNAFLRETLRRILGLEYRYRGIPVNSSSTFRFIRYLIREATLKGYDVYSTDNEVVCSTPFGEFSLNFADIDLLNVPFEPLNDMYGFVDVRDAVIVDIGAYIGETALFFLSKGAYWVYALEPVDRHYRYLLENISRNNVNGRVIPLNYGAYFRETVFSASYKGSSTGLRTTAGRLVTIRVRYLGDILREIFGREGRIDLVKMDCEGCEYSLITLSSEDIKLAKQYITEIHGSEIQIVDRMAECSYKHKFIGEVASLITLHYFTQ